MYLEVDVLVLIAVLVASVFAALVLLCVETGLQLHYERHRSQVARRELRCLRAAVKATTRNFEAGHLTCEALHDLIAETETEGPGAA